MIRLHDSLTMAEVKLAADIIGCRLVQNGSGDFVITPQRILEARSAQTNANIVKFPRHHRQFRTVPPPPGPDAA